MSTIELKNDLKRKIDLLPSIKFKKVYGKLVNTMNSQLDTEEWMSLNNEEKLAIEKGLLQARQGKVKTHEKVMEKFIKKYGVESIN